MQLQIKHRFTGSVLFETDVDDNDPRPVRTALVRVAAAHANLRDAYLARRGLAVTALAFPDGLRRIRPALVIRTGQLGRATVREPYRSLADEMDAWVRSRP
jgi:hypothetical protein